MTRARGARASGCCCCWKVLFAPPNMPPGCDERVGSYRDGASVNMDGQQPVQKRRAFWLPCPTDRALVRGDDFQKYEDTMVESARL